MEWDYNINQIRAIFNIYPDLTMFTIGIRRLEFRFGKCSSALVPDRLLFRWVCGALRVPTSADYAKRYVHYDDVIIVSLPWAICIYLRGHQQVFTKNKRRSSLFNWPGILRMSE